MNQRGDSVQYGHSDVFIRHDPAEIRGLVVVAPSHSQDFQFFSSTSGILFRLASDQERQNKAFRLKSSIQTTQRTRAKRNSRPPLSFHYAFVSSNTTEEKNGKNDGEARPTPGIFNI